MTKKVKWIAAAAALILLGVLAFAFKNNSEGTAGAKQITIHVKGVKHQETISIDSDCETLAELLKTHTELKAEVDNGPYGAYLITLLDETQASQKGPWWVYESDNNEVCTAMEYCPALDKVTIKDKDEFTFSLINELE